MIFKFKKIIKITNRLVIIALLTILSVEKIETYGKIYNQYKYVQLKQFLSDKTASLIMQTVTGDKRYRNDELINLYRNLQIIHILVISGGNITILLKFIHIFIYRKSMNTIFMSIIFTYFYGRLIQFPETLIRAMQTIFIAGLIDSSGLKKTFLRSTLVTTSVMITSIFVFKLGNSYLLSCIYSIAILFNSTVLNRKINNTTLRLIISNSILTGISALLFNFNTFSITCTSFIANIIINSSYDYAIYLSYILYILPTEYLPTSLKVIIFNLFSLIFEILNFTSLITYNVCDE